MNSIVNNNNNTLIIYPDLIGPIMRECEVKDVLVMARVCTTLRDKVYGSEKYKKLPKITEVLGEESFEIPLRIKTFNGLAILNLCMKSLLQFVDGGKGENVLISRKGKVRLNQYKKANDAAKNDFKTEIRKITSSKFDDNTKALENKVAQIHAGLNNVKNLALNVSFKINKTAILKFILLAAIVTYIPLIFILLYTYS